MTEPSIPESNNELDEMSTTDGAGAYNVPGAFTGNKKRSRERKARIAQALGYKLTKQGTLDLKQKADKLESVIKYAESVKLVSESVTKYVETAQVAKPHQRIGKAISEINKQLSQIDKALKRQSKFKIKENVNSSQLWKRTLGQLVKLESKLLTIAHAIRELKK